MSPDGLSEVVTVTNISCAVCYAAALMVACGMHMIVSDKITHFECHYPTAIQF